MLIRPRFDKFMEDLSPKQRILESIIGPYDNYCSGYPQQNGYLTALVMNVESFRETFSHVGSKVLDSIVAFDRAEVGTAYLGQINMILVSSFVGPEGLIWGYDLAREEETPLPSYLSVKGLAQEFPDIKIRNGEILRKAAIALLGTKEKKHFPFLPGSHVPCAGRFFFTSGPAYLYVSVAIGIPEDRSKTACLLMEDTGQMVSFDGVTQGMKQKIVRSSIRSVLEVGKNQNINYKEIFFDFVGKEINAGEIGCALVAMPYLHLAKNAYDEKLLNLSLNEWYSKKSDYFLDR